MFDYGILLGQPHFAIRGMAFPKLFGLIVVDGISFVYVCSNEADLVLHPLFIKICRMQTDSRCRLPSSFQFFDTTIVDILLQVLQIHYLILFVKHSYLGLESFLQFNVLRLNLV